MYGAVIGAVAGAVGGALFGRKSAKDKAQAYKRYADRLKSAVEQYKGQNLYNAMLGTGENIGKTVNNMSTGQQLNSGITQDNNATPLMTSNNISSDYQTGATLGQSLAKNDYDARFENEAQEAQNALDLDLAKSKVNDQWWQLGMNTASNGLGLLGKLKS